MHGNSNIKRLYYILNDFIILITKIMFIFLSIVRLSNLISRISVHNMYHYTAV